MQKSANISEFLKTNKPKENIKSIFSKNNPRDVLSKQESLSKSDQKSIRSMHIDYKNDLI